MASIDDEIKALQAKRAAGEFDEVAEGERIGLMSKGAFDSDIYGGGGDGAFAATVQDEMDEDDEGPAANHPSTRASINADRSILDAGTDADTGEDPFAAYREGVSSTTSPTLGC